MNRTAMTKPWAPRHRSPTGLRARLAAATLDEYPDARYRAPNETGLPEETLPSRRPDSIAEMLDTGFWPGAD